MHILLLPFKFVWTMLGLLGRVLAAVLGIVFLIVGVILTLTVVGAAVGIPLFIVGVLLLVRSVF